MRRQFLIGDAEALQFAAAGNLVGRHHHSRRAHRRVQARIGRRGWAQRLLLAPIGSSVSTGCAMPPGRIRRRHRTCADRACAMIIWAMSIGCVASAGAVPPRLAGNVSRLSLVPGMHRRQPAGSCQRARSCRQADPWRRAARSRWRARLPPAGRDHRGRGLACRRCGTAAVCVPTSTSGRRLSTLLVLQAETARVAATSAPRTIASARKRGTHANGSRREAARQTRKHEPVQNSEQV